MNIEKILLSSTMPEYLYEWDIKSKLVWLIKHNKRLKSFKIKKQADFINTEKSVMAYQDELVKILDSELKKEISNYELKMDKDFKYAEEYIKNSAEKITTETEFMNFREFINNNWSHKWILKDYTSPDLEDENKTYPIFLYISIKGKERISMLAQKKLLRFNIILNQIEQRIRQQIE